MDKLWCIELNLDEDYAKSTSYHIDEVKHRINENISHAEREQKTDRWVFVGLAYSIEEANDKAKKLRNILCERNHRKEINLNFD